MANQFDTSNVGTASGSSVTPQQPVVDRSSTQALGFFADIATQLGKVGMQLFQAHGQVEKQTQLNQAVASFSQQQLKLASAVDQGVMSSQEARMRMRANYTSAISNNPGLTSILADTQKDILNTSGLGKVVADGTAAEQAQQAVMREAAQAGWVKAGMTDDQSKAATLSFQEFKRAQQDIDAQQNKIALQRAQMGLTSDQLSIQNQRQSLATGAINQQAARLNLQEKQLQVKSQQALGSMAGAYHDKFASDLNAIQADLDAGKIDRATALQRINAEEATFSQVANGVGAGAGRDHVEALLAPMKMRAQNARDFTSGKITLDVLQNQNNTAEALQVAQLTSSPEIAQTIAMSKLARNASPNIARVIDDRLVGLFQKNGMFDGTNKPADLTSHNAQEASTNKNYFSMLKDSMTKVQSGSANDLEGTKQEVDTNLFNVMKGLNVYSLAVDNPNQLNEVVDFLASSDFGSYTTKVGGIPNDAVPQAKQVLEQQYSNVVLPTLKREYEKATVGLELRNTPKKDLGVGPFGMPIHLKDDQKASKLIQPVFNGTGVSFVSSVNDRVVQAKAKELNQKVAPILNRVVRMDAHLSGTQDYKAVYERNYANLFNQTTEQE